MHNPVLNKQTVSEIAITDISSIDRKASIADAVDRLIGAKYDFIIVTDDDTNRFFLLDIYIVLSICERNPSSAKRLSIDSIELPKLESVLHNETLANIVTHFKAGIRYLAIRNERNRPIGIVRQEEMISALDPITAMQTFRLSDLLTIKKRIRWVKSDESILEIADFMKRYKHDTVLVVENKKPIGIVTIKDILRYYRKGIDWNGKVADYMSSPVHTISYRLSLDDAIAFLSETQYERIVMIDEKEEVVGSITRKELLSLSFMRWASTIQCYHEELEKINDKLAEQSRKYETIATIDPLTGVYNRLKFLEIFISQYHESIREEKTLSFILIDIDNFKYINDTFGHNTGDDVLRQIARTMRKTLRNSDIICRWGGEEFTVLLPETTLHEAERTAERLRKALSTIKITSDHIVTASFGVTEVREGDTIESVVARADKALYRAKREGKNRVCIQPASD